MGFLSGITSAFMGKPSESTSQSGFALLPKEIQDAYKTYGTNVNNQIPSALTAYTPMGQTAGETQAYDAINRGFTPDQNQLNSDIQMQMNPWDTSVLDTINRQAGGEYSILKQSLGEAGQFGSNRQNLGANDIDLSRMNQIGTFKQNQYNNAIQNALGVLPGLRANDAALQLGAGDAQRNLGIQTASAPITGLQQIGSALGVLPETGGSTGKETGAAKGLLDYAAQAAGSYANATKTSDIRLKEDIKFIGQENGHNVYEFKYLAKPDKYIGVMAHEILKTHPSAVVVGSDGFMAVDYSQIGVEFRRSHGNLG